MLNRNAVPVLLIAAFLIFDLPTQADAGVVTIKPQNRNLQVSTPAMDVLIAPDGNMTSWRIAPPGDAIRAAPNIIKTGTTLPTESQIGGSRGAFFYQDALIDLTDVKVDGDHSIVASGDKASIRYDFEAAHLQLTLQNKTDKPMQFLMVFDPTVRAVGSATGEYRATPTLALWADTTWFQAKKKFTITGGTRIWGPGVLTGQDWKQGDLQIWEATLASRESRVVNLTVADATPEELTTLGGIAPEIQFRGSFTGPMIAPKPALAGDVMLYSPGDYRVFQRKSLHTGNVRIAGEVKVPCDKIEARLSGKGMDGPLPDKWQDVPFDPTTHAFFIEAPTPAGGWYQLEVRALQGGKEVATAQIPHVGVGEVFVTCGQSNSTNCGTPPSTTETGMVATFGGDDWRLANDPQPGARDPSTGGGPWPSFGDAMYNKYHVPIGVAVTGQGGAPVRNWEAGRPAFVWMMLRINQLGPGGFRALLWHQGEANVGQTNDEYFQALSSTVAASYSVAGWKFPWFVAQTSYHNPKEPSFPAPRGAQKQLWDAGIALEGPDTDTLTEEFRAGIHLNAKGLKKHGELWADKVSIYLDKVLAQP
jgi:hypothetical protein